MKYIAIIPVRGGSKGIPGKNIKKFYNGKSLTELTILSTFKVKEISEIYVSSDSDEILDHVKDYDVTLIKRDARLAQDDTSTVAVIMDHIKQYGFDNRWIFTLQVTSPFRDENHIRDAITMNNAQSEKSSMVSMKKVHDHPYWTYTIDSTNNNRMNPFHQPSGMPLRRQDLPPVFIPNGAFFLSYANQLLVDGNFYTNKTRAFVMDNKSSIDIDELMDWKIAQILAANLSNYTDTP